MSHKANYGGGGYHKINHVIGSIFLYFKGIPHEWYLQFTMKIKMGMTGNDNTL